MSLLQFEPKNNRQSMFLETSPAQIIHFDRKVLERLSDSLKQIRQYAPPVVRAQNPCPGEVAKAELALPKLAKNECARAAVEAILQGDLPGLQEILQYLEDDQQRGKEKLISLAEHLAFLLGTQVTAQKGFGRRFSLTFLTQKVHNRGFFDPGSVSTYLNVPATGNPTVEETSTGDICNFAVSSPETEFTRLRAVAVSSLTGWSS